MERKNGFINLDKEFIKLIKQNKQNIVQTSRCSTDAYWIKNFYNKNYLFKIITEENQKYRCLLIEEMAILIEIAVPHTELATWQKLEGELIEDYRKENCKYTPGAEILYEYYYTYQNTDIFDKILPEDFKNRPLEEEEITEVLKKLNNLETIWNALEFHFRKNPNREKIVYDITSKLANRFAFDFLTGQRDRHANNWEIEENPNGEAKLTPLFDSNRSFYQKFNLAMTINEESKNQNAYQELKYYLTYSTKEFCDFFYTIYQFFTPLKIIQILEDIERKKEMTIPPKNKKSIITSYQKHYEKITQILKERQKTK